MQASEHSNDDFLFIDDSEDDQIVDETSGETWKVLIVDDDPEIHSVTQLALSDLTVLGRRLEYLHAYSGEEAIAIIEQDQDIVLVLLDVVMESDDAGLQVVKHIREQLNREDIRIVLRTGQPGYAPEESVIKDYDINDYKTKTELTRRKLVTTVYAAIRSYQQITTVSQGRAGLEKIINSASNLLELHSIQEFGSGVLTQLKTLLNGYVRGAFCARGHGIIDGADDLGLYALAQDGWQANAINEKVEQIGCVQLTEAVNACFQHKEHLCTSDHIAFYLVRSAYRAVIYIELEKPITNLEMQLAEVFLSNVSIGYENVHLFQKLRNAAYKDWLTELPNRLQFLKTLDQFSAEQADNTVAALVDINHFSDINDGLGQDVGNQLLRAVALRLLSIDKSLSVARVGADVFGIVGDEEMLSPDILSEVFSQPFDAGEQTLPVNVCIGICRKRDAGQGGVKVLNQINIALNLAKKNRDKNIQYYKQEMEDQTLWRLGMIRQLRTDFAENRLALWYQPQLDLETGKVIGAEALLRWRTSDGNFISPAVFIPLAEYSGLILDIGDWVVHQACQHIKAVEAHGFNDVGISINVSIPQFRQDDFVSKVIAATRSHDIEAAKLELEITENILMDDPQLIIDALQKLKAEGISIALDDFGTGYSSLSYLQKLPIDRLKVDRSFINDVTEDGNSLLADTIINLGKQLDLKVIAEGIENLEQEAHLVAQGCDEVQGFYYAKPMPADDFLAFLKERS
ncbi:EAL domain-containing protein [Thalassotalea euphylliae]|uniref:EAL domain-containing protein n=1 Tax=Thalassotalea euphylliae TaxID=1655234 RepID=A0A3E0TLM0_9GAMM|nr:EAL domain-containing protein [Thalassotalea euphylliae]REL25441.1 EAL domain-containing protein [Thalassotalea euphylliae]